MLDVPTHNAAPGYHLKAIPKGKTGELSKVLEEVHEAIDSEEQGVKIMTLVELSDVYGAITCYLAKHHQGVTMKDLSDMSRVTHRAFESGGRKSSDAS